MGNTGKATHIYGGAHTRRKLEILRAYMGLFTKVMKNQTWDIHYIDGFAGTGEQSFKTDQDLLGEEGIISLDGSVKMALKESFTHYHFVELKKDHIEALEELKATSKKKNQIHIHQGDANTLVKDLCQQIDWRCNRGIIFVDPYGMEVDWETLAAIANTKLDMWFLFPLTGLIRNAPKSKKALDSHKRAALTRILGTPEWEDKLYSQEEVAVGATGDLFGDTCEPELQLNVKGLEHYVTERLGTLFPHVAEPVTLHNKLNVPIFSFYFAMANDSEKAKALANRLVTGVRKSLHA
jgi:three-Cys-motif partner protein